MSNNKFFRRYDMMHQLKKRFNLYIGPLYYTKTDINIAVSDFNYNDELRSKFDINNNLSEQLNVILDHMEKSPKTMRVKSI